MSGAYFLIALLIAYLMGSFSFAIIVTRWMGLSDPRSYGSGNPGATNVLRSGSKLAAILTLLGDGLKGWLAVFFAQRYGVPLNLGSWLVPLVGLAVFLGHLFPVYHGFKGGKGVATGMGVLLGFDIWLGLATLATWVIIAFFFRYSSLAALLSAVFASFYNLLLFGFDEQQMIVMILSGLLIYRHRSNIIKLMQGKESRIGAKKN